MHMLTKTAVIDWMKKLTCLLLKSPLAISMDKDKLLKELSNPVIIRERFFKYLHEILSFHKAQKEASLTSESPEYIKYDDAISKTFTDVTPEQEQILRIVLNLNLAFFETIADNNRRLLSLIFGDSSEADSYKSE